MQQACEYFCEANDLDDDLLEEAIPETEPEKKKLNAENAPIDPISTFKNIYSRLKPEVTNSEIQTQYRSSTVDPFLRLNQLKTELGTVTKEISDYIKLNESNILLKEAENFTNIINELDQYKIKLDTFNESPIYKLAKEKEISSKDTKKEYTRLITEYSKSTKKLFDTISQMENSKTLDLNDVLTENIDFIANVDTTQKIDQKDIEAKLSSLEKLIGNWEMYKENKSIVHSIKDKIHLMDETNTEAIEKLKVEFDKLFIAITELKENCPLVFEHYMKVRDTYSILEFYESFDELFEYLKKRLKAVITFHDDSVKFKDNADKLSQNITTNEKSLDELGKRFTSTIDEFNKLELLLKDFNEIETILKQKYMI